MRNLRRAPRATPAARLPAPMTAPFPRHRRPAHRRAVRGDNPSGETVLHILSERCAGGGSSWKAGPAGAEGEESAGRRADADPGEAGGDDDADRVAGGASRKKGVRGRAEEALEALGRVSPATNRPYPLTMVCETWRVARSSVYVLRARLGGPLTSDRRQPGKRGPKTALSDEDLVAEIRPQSNSDHTDIHDPALENQRGTYGRHRGSGSVPRRFPPPLPRPLLASRPRRARRAHRSRRNHLRRRPCCQGGRRQRTRTTRTLPRSLRWPRVPGAGTGPESAPAGVMRK